MISFWVDAAGSFGMEQYLATRAQHLADRIEVRLYEHLTQDFDVPAGAHIFAALDQLTAGGRGAVAALYDQASRCSPAGRLLNNPRRVLQRYELLTKLFDDGLNSFRARRATEAIDAAHFPVFVREESGHNGALTGLLASRREVARALFALRARGFQAADLLVVEFCDLSDAEGLFRTASAFKVGQHIVPAHLLSGRNWMLKWDASEHGERAMQEHLDYVVGNPHEAWVRRVFALAEVDYGRIDYGVRGQTLQVWEINTNPTLGPSRGPPPATLVPKLEAMLQQARTVHHSALQIAFRALESDMDHSRVAVRIDPALMARMRAETDRAQRRRAVLGFLHGIYRHPRIGRLFRAAYSHLLPRL